MPLTPVAVFEGEVAASNVLGDTTTGPELDESTADKVAEHLEDCRRCGMAADVYLEIKASLGRDAPAVPEEALSRLEDFARRLSQTEQGEP